MSENTSEPTAAEAQELEAFVESLRLHGRFLPIWLALASLIGLLASAALVLEKISYWQQKAEGTAPTLTCNLSAYLNCGGVINTDPASIFWDLPSPVLGVVGFSSLLTVAVLLMSKTRLPNWFWGGVQAGVVFGLSLVTYLQYQSIYNLNVLCPFCMVVWAVMIPTFWAVTNRNLSAWAPLSRAASFMRAFLPLVVLLHFILLITLIFLEFGSRLWA